MRMTGPRSDIPKTILLATDLSARCDRAADRAALLADEWQADLVVLHVLENPYPSKLYDVEPVPSWRRPPDPAAIAQESLLEDLGLATARSRIRIREGDPVDTILSTAETEGCDVIVTGVAQDEEFGRFRLGRTVDRLLRRSRLPLLVVRNRPQAPYCNIVAATDFSAPSGYAFDAAERFFPERKLTLFHAYDAPGSRLMDNAASFHMACESAVKEAGERFMEGLGPFGRDRPRPDLLIEPGSASRLLREFVRLRKVDLVTMGTRGRNSLLDVFLGSTAKEIMATLPCDALVVREPQAPAEA